MFLLKYYLMLPLLFCFDLFIHLFLIYYWCKGIAKFLNAKMRTYVYKTSIRLCKYQHSSLQSEGNIFLQIRKTCLGIT